MMPEIGLFYLLHNETGQPVSIFGVWRTALSDTYFLVFTTGGHWSWRRAAEFSPAVGLGLRALKVGEN